MSKLSLFSVSALLAITSTVAAGNHGWNVQHASSCGVKSGSIINDERGAINTSSSTSAAVVCEGRYLSDYSVEANYSSYGEPLQMNVWYRDRSTTHAFSCYPFITKIDGSSSWGPTKFACSTEGGCDDLTTTYSGTGVIEFQTPDGWGEIAGVVCTIPPASSSGESYVKAVNTH